MDLGLDSLSWLPWSQWAQVTDSLHEDHAQSLELLRTAALVISLPPESEPSLTRSGGDRLSQQAAGVLCCGANSGLPSGLWKEKAFQLVVLPNGTAGLSCHYPLADPIAVAQLWEFTLAREAYPLSKAGADSPRTKPRELKWKLKDAARPFAEASCEVFKREAQLLDLRVTRFDGIGWRAIRELKVHPHAYLHIAAQIAVFRVWKTTSFCFERVPLHLFSGGRSTYADCVCKEILDFWEKLQKKERLGQAECRKAFRKACRAFQRCYTRALCGDSWYLQLQALTSIEQNLEDHENPIPGNLKGRYRGLDGACIWLTPIHQDPKTPGHTLSIGGNFCEGPNFLIDQSVQIGFAALGDDDIYLHVRQYTTACYYLHTNAEEASHSSSEQVNNSGTQIS